MLSGRLWVILDRRQNNTVKRNKNMVENNQTTKQRQSYDGAGLVLGCGIGAILGVLPLPGNTGWLIGGLIGAVIGLVVGSNVNCLGFIPAYTLLAMAAGAAAGAGLCLAANQLLHVEWLSALGIWFGLAAGLVAGTTLDVRKKRTGV